MLKNFFVNNNATQIIYYLSVHLTNLFCCKEFLTNECRCPPSEENERVHWASTNQNPTVLTVNVDRGLGDTYYIHTQLQKKSKKN